MSKLNLFSDNWIPATTIEGCRTISFSALVSPAGFEVLSIDCHPVSRMAIVRMAMAWKAWADRYQVVGERPLGLVHREWFDLATAFQVDGLPESSARSAHEIINMLDGNGVAWSPLPAPVVTEADLAMALVTAAFCDRGGLKARVEGLPISAQTPLHIGQRIQLKRGSSIGELLANNPVRYDSDYQPPWITGMIYPDRTTPRDELELLLWPWRRLKIFGDGITIAPGASIDKTVVDPWAIDKASLKHLKIAPSEEFETTALVLSQAMPVACWLS